MKAVLPGATAMDVRVVMWKAPGLMTVTPRGTVSAVSFVPSKAFCPTEVTVSAMETSATLLRYQKAWPPMWVTPFSTRMVLMLGTESMSSSSQQFQGGRLSSS